MIPHGLQIHVYATFFVIKYHKCKTNSWKIRSPSVKIYSKQLLSGETLKTSCSPTRASQPMVSSKDLSEKGYSKRPATNFTLSILSTASSILVICISPDSTRDIKSSINYLYR
ncbi:hypothetical protein EPI10_033247 [Gossypium australe]|uniref:Uncharacterized protein n=1 Tax=Gossypium australe TaxID=47621 RepID=A0A5B6X8U7_9ROSI|nr:hypothetical protein EPI10_033247 [Gossypium australe]